MELSQKFQEAVAASKTLTKKPSNDTLLQLYALYKQASSGDVTGNKPKAFDFVGQAKYSAWEKLKGTAQTEAEEQYITLMNELLETHK